MTTNIVLSLSIMSRAIHIDDLERGDSDFQSVMKQVGNIVTPILMTS
jgi:hypothetical protein